MHQDYWTSEISLFSVVSTPAVSVCPWDRWQFLSPDHLSIACWLVSEFDLLMIFCISFATSWVSLALQFVAKGVEMRLPPQVQELVSSGLARLTWHFDNERWLGPEIIPPVVWGTALLLLEIIDFFDRIRLLAWGRGYMLEATPVWWFSGRGWHLVRALGTKPRKLDSDRAHSGNFICTSPPRRRRRKRCIFIYLFCQSGFFTGNFTFVRTESELVFGS